MDFGVFYVDKIFLDTIIIVFALTIINALVMYSVIRKGVKDAIKDYDIEKKTMKDLVE